MEGVAQNDLCAHLMQAAWHHTFDRSIGAHGHKDRCLDHTVVQSQGVGGLLLDSSANASAGTGTEAPTTTGLASARIFSKAPKL